MKVETKTDLTEMVTSMEEPVEEVTTRVEDNAGASGDRYQPCGTGGAEEQGRTDRNGGGGTNFLG